jgi:hypothetical protein
MRRHPVVLLTMLTMGIAASASAQVAFPPNAVTTGPQATREDVVARLMSFDRNDDGRLTRAELPERLHGLLTRGDVDKDETIDSVETFKLAERPIANAAASRGFQPGQYGFGDTSFQDSRLHIEGAIEDLRLSANDRNEALEIARGFAAAREEKTKTDLLQTMGTMLTPGSFEDFKAALEQPAAIFRAFPGGVVGPNDSRLVQAVQVLNRLQTAGNLARAVDKYGLQPDDQKRALAAIERYNEARSGRLGDGDRVALLERLKPLLDDEQIDDLRAALERRPIVKQNAAKVVVNTQFGVPGSSPSPRGGVAVFQNLVLKD